MVCTVTFQIIPFLTTIRFGDLQLPKCYSRICLMGGRFELRSRRRDVSSSKNNTSKNGYFRNVVTKFGDNCIVNSWWFDHGGWHKIFNQNLVTKLADPDRRIKMLTDNSSHAQNSNAVTKLKRPPRLVKEIVKIHTMRKIRYTCTTLKKKRKHWFSMFWKSTQTANRIISKLQLSLETLSSQ